MHVERSDFFPWLPGTFIKTLSAAIATASPKLFFSRFIKLVY